MKLNNKGITLVEIIISIALISIVLIFLFSLLITVNDMNTNSKVNSSYLVNKALIIKNIEEDLKDATKAIVRDCNISDFYSSYGYPNANSYFGTGNKNKANLCLKFTLTKKTETGTTVTEDAYLGVYYYKSRDFYVISYINESQNIKATRELPDFISENINESNGQMIFCDILKRKIYIKQNDSIKSYFDNYGNKCQMTTGHVEILDPSAFATINIPMIGADGKDYSILIPFSPNKN